MIVNAGVIAAAGSSKISYGSLVDKLIDLGATEIWLHDDASGGAVALFDSANDLAEVDGSNFVYRQESKCFPGTYMIDASEQTGNQSFFSTTSPATALQTTGDCSVISIGSASGSYSFNDAPICGLASATTGSSADNTLLKYGEYSTSSTSLRCRFGHDGFETTKTLINNNYSDSAEFVSIVSRDSAAKEYEFAINGEELAAEAYASNPTGGENCLFIEGRDVNDLTSTKRPERFYGVSALFKKKLTSAERKQITDAAFDFEERVGDVPDYYFNAQVWTGNTLIDGACLVRSRGTDHDTTLSGSSNTIGLVAYEIQMGTGRSSFSASSGYTITGDTSTVNKGDIIKIECVADKEFVGTLYSSS